MIEIDTRLCSPSLNSTKSAIASCVLISMAVNTVTASPGASFVERNAKFFVKFVEFRKLV
jgi:hypothetical protein